MGTYRFVGHGLSLKRQHFSELLESGTAGIDWFEVISENFFGPGGRPWSVLEQLRADAPVALHGTNLGLGNADGIDADYLRRLSALAERLDPVWISDHLCFGAVDGEYAHDLLPLPHTEPAVEHVVEQIDRVQNALGRKILVENVSTYLRFDHDEMDEAEFVAEVIQRADCLLLLDVNNVVVNGHNHDFDPEAYLDRLPTDRVGEIHLAGATAADGLLIDTHVGPVPEPVWALYQSALRRFGPVSTIVEWDTDVPTLAVAVEQVQTARRLQQQLAPAGALGSGGGRSTAAVSA